MNNSIIFKRQLPSSVSHRIISQSLRAYFKEIGEIFADGRATEHSYRLELENLVKALGGFGIRALNEPAQSDCGAPDFVVQKVGVPIGYIECKNIGSNLNKIQNGEQLTRYRDGLPNLILTDYLEFRWYTKGELRDTASIGAVLSLDKITTNKPGMEKVANLFKAFFEESIQTVHNPLELAEKMAGKARLLRESISELLNQETETSLHRLWSAYRKALISELTLEEFADMQSQTISYGLFAARCQHQADGTDFSRETAIFAKITPFLQEVLGEIAGPKIHHRIEWIVDDLVYLLKRADMEAILENFNQRSSKEDAVVHFYENFLKEYDPELRRVRGAYYTPKPVVSYIVRSVDYLLRDRFCLKRGMADRETIEIDAGDGRTELSPRVLILDPAAGTGTFLREAIRTIRSTIEKEGMAGAWSDYVRDHLLPRLFGFELMMGPYAICHLNLALEVAGERTGFTMDSMEKGRLNVFLTDSLEEAEEKTGALFLHEITKEAASASGVKRKHPVMAIIGNPPWNVHSKNKGDWIVQLLKGQDGLKKTSSYFEIDGRPLGEKNSKMLNDDYVKFIRFAQWRIEKTGEGVIGFVTNNGWLDNVTFRGMRQCLLKTFDDIYVLNLHGSTKADVQKNDENVFDIEQGVAIVFLAKYKRTVNELAKVRYASIRGKRESKENGGKYEYLLFNDVNSTNWTELFPRTPHYVLLQYDQTFETEYEKGWSLNDIFPKNKTGIKTHKDKVAYQWTKNDMKNFVSDFLMREPEDARTHHGLGKDVESGWVVSTAQDDLRSKPNLDECILPVLYRPFDIRFTCYTGKSGFIVRPRPELMPNMLAGNNLALISCRQKSQSGFPWSLTGVTRLMIDMCALSNKTREGNYLFPLYFYPENSLEKCIPNLKEDFIKELEDCIDMKFTPEGVGCLELTFGPENVIHYIYSILHSLEYRNRYGDLLKYAFPKIPLTKNRSLFVSLANIGKQLTEHHLMESDSSDWLKPVFPISGDGIVTKPMYKESNENSMGQVWINDQQYFEGVSMETWNCKFGSFNPAEYWLKVRKGKELRFDDIEHYRNICAILAKTQIHIKEIDETIDTHGSWPLV